MPAIPHTSHTPTDGLNAALAYKLLGNQGFSGRPPDEFPMFSDVLAFCYHRVAVANRPHGPVALANALAGIGTGGFRLVMI